MGQPIVWTFCSVGTKLPNDVGSLFCPACPLRVRDSSPVVCWGGQHALSEFGAFQNYSAPEAARSTASEDPEALTWQCILASCYSIMPLHERKLSFDRLHSCHIHFGICGHGPRNLLKFPAGPLTVFDVPE